MHPLVTQEKTDRPAAKEPRHLADLLRARPDGVGPVVADREALSADPAEPGPLLYTAYRDGIPARPLAPADAEAFHWRGDFVEYEGGVLADGEPVRSIGHWNSTDQLEVFEVESGRVVMLIAPPGGERVWLAEYGPGDLALIPPGWFHLTGSPWKRADVFNVYTAREGGGGTDVSEKYHSRVPLPCVVTMQDGQPRATWLPGDHTPGRVISEQRPLPVELDEEVRERGGLRGVLAECTDEELVAFAGRLRAVRP
ncbi:hypothetical protein [Streptomyces sp. NBC_01497]|uniref:hypothetical protein n=1 Tax=Streptomyces sp. NBC_01497 TaxID=2903885 RepID=UPI002E2EFC19|nr:hypothetical protein [Streptomyces sp. NBC_01497]